MVLATVGMHQAGAFLVIYNDGGTLKLEIWESEVDPKESVTIDTRRILVESGVDGTVEATYRVQYDDGVISMGKPGDLQSSTITTLPVFNFGRGHIGKDTYDVTAPALQATIPLSSINGSTATPAVETWPYTGHMGWWIPVNHTRNVGAGSPGDGVRNHAAFHKMWKRLVDAGPRGQAQRLLLLYGWRECAECPRAESGGPAHGYMGRLQWTDLRSLTTSRDRLPPMAPQIQTSRCLRQSAGWMTSISWP